MLVHGPKRAGGVGSACVSRAPPHTESRSILENRSR